jgi:hypothetical protein
MNARVSFEARYLALAEKFVGRRLGPADGVSERELASAERRLHVRLPASLRTFYRTAGRAPDLARAHNVLLDPGEVKVEGQFLVFLNENQSVVSWGFRVADLASEDPVVWQRNNTPPVEWYSERKRLPRFLQAMFGWHAQVGVWPPSPPARKAPEHCSDKAG